MNELERQYQEIVGSIREHSHERAMVLVQIAEQLREQDRHLAAGLCSLAGHHEAWGIEPQDLCPQLLVDAINDLLRFLSTNPLDDWAKLLALQLLAQTGHPFFFSGQNAEALVALQDSALFDYQVLLGDLAQGHLEANSLLVTGFQLQGFLDDNWVPAFSDFEISAGTRTIQGDGRLHVYGMNSAFHSLVAIGDYGGASRISAAHSEWLTTPGLRGWAHASEALSTGNSPAFAKAAEEFASDSHDRAERREQHWSGINQQLWAGYFQSRYHLATESNSPNEAAENLRMATGGEAEKTVWHVPQVKRYYRILGAFRGLVDGNDDTVRRQLEIYERDRKMDLPSPLDAHVVDCLNRVQDLSGAATETDWISLLLQLIHLLDRLPFTQTEKANMTLALNVALPKQLLGWKQGWEYRALATLSDERQLHRILLQLFRAEKEVPLYSHIHHGPIEYGKDIVVFREEGDKRILSMYSVKIGVLKKQAWQSKVRPQLEEMFQVPFSSPELTEPVDETIGVLVWNDHIHSYAEPLVSGWITEQQETFGRRFELMHIDALVGYIKERCLGLALREALRDEGLMP